MVFDSNGTLPQKNAAAVVGAKEIQPNHALMMDQSRRAPTVSDLLKQYEIVAGHAQREQLATELYNAGQINRGPPGTFERTNLHQDVITGMDERIGFGFLQ